MGGESSLAGYTHSIPNPRLSKVGFHSKITRLFPADSQQREKTTDHKTDGYHPRQDEAPG